MKNGLLSSLVTVLEGIALHVPVIIFVRTQLLVKRLATQLTEGKSAYRESLLTPLKQPQRTDLSYRALTDHHDGETAGRTTEEEQFYLGGSQILIGTTALAERPVSKDVQVIVN